MEPFLFPPLPTPWDEKAKAFAREALEREVYGAWSTPETPVVMPRQELRAGREIAFAPFPFLCATPPTPGPWPVLVGVNFYGLHTLDDDDALPAPEGWNYSEPSWRGCHSERWPLARITESGWAVASAFVGDIEPDDPSISGGEAVSKWAQGIVRIGRTLATDPRFDSRRIVAVGHSRLGKAALLAAVMDDRIAGVVAIQTGCGGAGPSRTTVGETVADIVHRFPHWFSQKFATYAEDPNRLPLDQHWLLALCASRPLLLCSASEDLWANPDGQHEMLRLAAATRGLSLPDLKLGGTVGVELAHFYRVGRHEVVATDWDAILPWLAERFGMLSR